MATWPGLTRECLRDAAQHYDSCITEARQLARATAKDHAGGKREFALMRDNIRRDLVNELRMAGCPEDVLGEWTALIVSHAGQSGTLH